MFTTTSSTVSTGQGNAKQIIDFTYPKLVVTPENDAKSLVDFYGTKNGYARILTELNKRAEINAGNTARASKRIDPKEKLSTAMVYAMDEMLDDMMEVKARGRVALESWLMQTVWPLSQEHAEYQNL